MRRQKTREILIRTAINCFCQKGYLDTTIREIGDKAGFNESIIYHYFKNKEDLLFEIINKATQDLIEALQQIENEIQESEECLWEMLRLHVSSFSYERKKEAKIVVSDTEFLRGKRLTIILEKQRKIYDLYKKKLEELKYKGRLKNIDLTVANYAIFGVINSSLRWVQDKGRLTSQEIVDNVIRFVCHGILKE